MYQINQYTVINKSYEFNEKIALWICEKNDRGLVEVLTIQKDETYNRIVERVIKYDIGHLLNKDIQGIQTIHDTGFDETNGCYFIAYEYLEGYTFFKLGSSDTNSNSVLDLARGLDLLNKENLRCQIIDKRSVKIDSKGNSKLGLVGLFELFKHQGLLDKDYLAPNVVEWMEGNSKIRPNHQDDIYSVVKLFEGHMGDNELGNKIIAKGLADKRIERFIRYYELIELLDKMPVSKVKVGGAYFNCIQVKTQYHSTEFFQPILEEMKQRVWFLVENKRSKEKDQITGRFSTKSWNGRFFLDKQNYLFISFPGCRNEKHDAIIKDKNSFLTDFDFSSSPSDFNCINFFENKFEEINRLSELYKTKTNLVKEWKVLPEKEKEFIEESAFKAKFSSREACKNNPSNIKFLTNELRSWVKIKELRREHIVLFINDLAIGKILDYHPKENFITIGDVYCTIDEIPLTGELIQDVRQETSQYKKQIEACEMFRIQDVVNSDLCSILSTPESTAMPPSSSIFEEDYSAFNKTIFNKDLLNDESQRDAVLEALNKKPVFLIQGPPGTGKTTVIIELIRQILTRQKNAKILVTSQSNLAVDNVLEKIHKVNERSEHPLNFMRLASEHSLEKENITNEILPYTFENKLSNWVKDTERRSCQNFETIFPKSKKQQEFIRLYDYFSTLNGADKWSDFVKRLGRSINYLKDKFCDANNLNEAKDVFEKELGKDFLKKRTLQREWFAFLGGVNVDDGHGRKKSMLNNGSTEIDFLMAMMQDVSIIGATCIHIASGKYNKVNFRFDYVIMDESSKASAPETLVPINMGKNIILIGDDKQLPPVITREKKVVSKVKKELEDNGLDFNKKFGISLFERLVHAFENDSLKEQYVKMLDIQYRMPRQIGNLISKHFYNGKLKNVCPSIIPNYDKDKEHGLEFKSKTSLVFISTSDKKNPFDNGNKYKRNNPCNVESIEHLLTQLNELYPHNLEKEQPFTIGIIAGYRGQVELLQDKINLTKYSNFLVVEQDESGNQVNQSLIEINTVDKFQGAERDIIIYDVVRSSSGNDIIGFLEDYRRINVAFSRVKRLLCVVGDSEYLLKRAMIHPDSQFKEFKLKHITEDLKREGVIVNDLKELLK
jgi:DNA polymerase III delta prime subunit